MNERLLEMKADQLALRWYADAVQQSTDMAKRHADNPALATVYICSAIGFFLGFVGLLIES